MSGWKQQRNARLARRVLIDGRLTAPVPAERHGVASTYTNHGCRCVACSDEWNAYMGRRSWGVPVRAAT